MCTNLFKDSRIFNFIQEIDKDSEATASLRPCTHCNGKLDRSDYWRKPRGIPGEFEAAFSRRPSFCCRVDGCRRRATPLQLRFLSRRVYVSIVVLIAAAMTQGPSPKRLSVIEKELEWQHEPCVDGSSFGSESFQSRGAGAISVVISCHR